MKGAKMAFKMPMNMRRRLSLLGVVLDGEIEITNKPTLRLKPLGFWISEIPSSPSHVCQRDTP